MEVVDWNIEELTGYKPISTFYSDFSIADKFGLDAIQDTFDRVFNEWKSDYKYLTELVMVMSWKSFEHYEKDLAKANLYSKLYAEADEYACDNLKGEELDYYFKTTD